MITGGYLPIVFGGSSSAPGPSTALVMTELAGETSH